MYLLPLAVIEPPTWTTVGGSLLFMVGLAFWAAKRFFDDHLATVNSIKQRLDSTERALHDKLTEFTRKLGDQVSEQERRLIRAEAADGEHQRSVERLEGQLRDNTKITSEQNARIDGLAREVNQLTMKLVEWGARLDERIGLLPKRSTDA